MTFKGGSLSGIENQNVSRLSTYKTSTVTFWQLIILPRCLSQSFRGCEVSIFPFDLKIMKTFLWVQGGWAEQGISNSGRAVWDPGNSWTWHGVKPSEAFLGVFWKSKQGKTFPGDWDELVGGCLLVERSGYSFNSLFWLFTLVYLVTCTQGRYLAKCWRKCSFSAHQ